MKTLGVGATMVATAVAMASMPACAQDATRYDIAEQSLAEGLRAFARISGREVVVESEAVAGKRGGRVSGTLSAERAIESLLDRTGLSATVVNGAFVVRLTPMSTTGERKVVPQETDIVVTGSRIKGGPAASPVIIVTREDARNSGQASLGDLVRSIPQSFGGGQNPGVGAGVPSANGVNVGGGSSVNLRGLGSDATLTLLNGHRLTYSSSRQSVDVSAIPFGVVERVEVVADGASAIYGSDAVAGVVNVITRRDVDGVETRARLGTSTEGGNFQQQYGLVAGARWAAGGIMAAYEFDRASEIVADDRPYAVTRPNLTLFPRIERHNAALTGSHSIGNTVTLAFDALYNRRRTRSVLPLNFAGDLTLSRQESTSRSKSFSIAPALTIRLSDDWEASASGTYGEDRVRFQGDTYTASVLTSTAGGCYCNSAETAELGATGTIVDLPAGAAKIAVGAGYRNNDFELFRGIGNAQNARNSQSSVYAFGEINVPLVAPAQNIGAIYRLSVTGAVRYERYRRIGNIATPKLGIVYAPLPDIDLKASWGRSFRAPTFLQQYQVQALALVRATSVGGVGYPATATALVFSGGNPVLAPERARSWSATAAFHPTSVPGAHLEVSYFKTRYTDRIVSPVTFLAQALRDPIYAQRVVVSPTSAQQAALMATAGQFTNGAGATYDPARVVAIVDNTNVNAGRQSINGIDLLLGYRTALGAGRSFSAALTGSYLESEQQLSRAQPIQQLAGLIFNPPHFRARGTAAWNSPTITIAATVSYVGNVDDRRAAVSQEVDAMATFDLTARIRSPRSSGLLAGIELGVSAQNIFNAEPDPIPTSLYFDTPYDSTNYSPVGRFLSIEVLKRW